MDLLVRAAFGNETEPVKLDGTKQHAPAFTNLAATPVDDAWAANTTWRGVNLNTAITVKMTHEPQ